MARVNSSDPDRMVFRSGGGCLMLFGMPFLLAGLAVMTGPLWGIKDSKTKKPIPWAFAVPFGAVFAAVGASIAFGRAGKEIDRRAATVTTWWGLLVPFKSTTRPLADFEAVQVTKEVRRSKNSTYTVYPVKLKAAKGKDVSLEESRDAMKARKAGEEAAKFLSFKLVDRSLGETIVREAEELDESLRDRATRTGERAGVPDPPAGGRCTHSVVGDTLVFEIPPTGFKAGHIVAMLVGALIPIIVVAFFAFPMLRDDKMPSGAKLIFMLFLGAFFIGLPLVFSFGAAISSAKARTTVEVSPGLLKVTRSGLLGSKMTAIPTDELEELRLMRGGAAGAGSVQAALAGKAQVILPRSDNATVTFGTGLSNAELEWMQAIIQNVVTV
ncbi:hypothetical protein HQ576_19465 [bacterium]|nr:hypothetical protein [bacterium]